MILLVAHSDDLHVKRIERELLKRKADFIWFDTSLYPNNIKLDISIINGIFEGYINISGKKIKLSNIKSAFFKEIKLLDAIRDKHTVNKSEYVISESQEALYTLWQSLSLNNCVWVNDPNQMILSSTKFNQLLLAKEIGFKVPNTLISNNISSSRDFCFSKNSSSITKLLNSGTVVRDDDGFYYGIPTSIVEKEKFNKYSVVINYVPYCFQELVEKGTDIRITVVGEKLFPIEIISNEIDWRTDDIENIPHVKHLLPEEIERMCIDLLKKVGYKYGAIDMIKNKNGDYYFLEINSIPAWAWVEDKTGYKICSAICDLLTEN